MAAPSQPFAATLLILMLLAAAPCDGQSIVQIIRKNAMCHTGSKQSTHCPHTNYCMEEITLKAGVPANKVAQSCGGDACNFMMGTGKETGSTMRTTPGKNGQSYVYCCNTDNCNDGNHMTPVQLKEHPKCDTTEPGLGVEVCHFPDSLCFYGVGTVMKRRGEPTKVRGCMPKADCIALAKQQAGGTGVGCGYFVGLNDRPVFDAHDGSYVCCCKGDNCNKDKEADIGKQSLCEAYQWDTTKHVTKASVESAVQLCSAEDRKDYTKYKARTDDNMCVTRTVKIPAERMALIAPLAANATKASGAAYESVKKGCGSRLKCMLALGGDGEKCATSNVGGKTELCCKRAPDASAAARPPHGWPLVALAAAAAALLAADGPHP